MAEPAYTNDLTTIVDFDGTPSSPSVSEPSSGWTAGRSPAVDTDFPIQGTNHCSLIMNTTGKAGVLCSNGDSFSWTSGDYLFGWIVWLAPGAIAERSSGGLAMLCGSSISAYKVFYVGGKTYGAYPYGGWQNFAVDPEMTYDEVVGSPSAYNIVGGGANVLSSVSKGAPLGFDVFRYGRGIFYIDGGESGDYANFTDMAEANDNTTARWGLFQSIAGGFKQKGILSFGENSLCEFVDSNKAIVIDDSIYVASDFNRIEIHNTSSIISWTNCSISSLCAISLGQFEMIDNATVTFYSCLFKDMDTFIFQSNAVISGCTFLRCGKVTQGGASMTGLTFSASTGTAALVVNSISNISKCNFISAGTGYAIEGFSAAGDYTITDVTFTGYAGSDGSTGNETIHVLATSGIVNINISGGTTPTIHTAGATVNVIIPETTLTLTGMQTESDISILTAGTTTERVNVQENSGTSYPYNYSYAENDYIDIGVFKAGYIPFYIRNYLLGNTNSSIPISQVIDRAYLE